MKLTKMSLFSLLAIYLVMPIKTEGQTRIGSAVIGSGGGRAESNTSRMIVTGGQPIIGQASSSNFGYRAGFWYQSNDFITSLEQIQSELLPKEFRLGQNYPNPFNPITTISYNLPKTSDARIEIFNILGQRVATLINERKTAGYHTVDFDGTRFSSGVYLYQIQAGEYIAVKKMVLMK